MIASAGKPARTPQGVVILAASVMPIMAIISLVPVLPLLLREFAVIDGSEFLVPAALTIPALCVAVFSPLAGWLSDKVGRKPLLVAALVLYAAFGIIPWFLNDLFQIIGARIALGVVEAVIMTVATALIGDYFEGARRERWIALQVAVGSLAAIVLIAVGGALGDALGSRGPFLLYLLALPVALAAALILFEPQAHSNDTEARGPTAALGAVLPLVLTTLGVGVVFYTMIVQLGPVLERAGAVSPGVIGIIGALTNLGVAVGTVIFGILKGRAGPSLLFAGLLVAAIGYAGTGIFSQLAAIGGFAVVACVGSGILLPNMLAWTMRSLPSHLRGRGMGLWTGAFFLGQFLAPLVIAGVEQATGTLANALLVYAALITAAAIFAVWLRSGSNA